MGGLLRLGFRARHGGRGRGRGDESDVHVHVYACGDVRDHDRGHHGGGVCYVRGVLTGIVSGCARGSLIFVGLETWWAAWYFLSGPIYSIPGHLLPFPDVEGWLVGVLER